MRKKKDESTKKIPHKPNLKENLHRSPYLHERKRVCRGQEEGADDATQKQAKEGGKAHLFVSVLCVECLPKKKGEKTKTNAKTKEARSKNKNAILKPPPKKQEK